MADLSRTPLYEAHKALGAKIVPFAGWEMPVQYSGIMDEHRAVRTDVGAFDVSHMGEVLFRGPRAAEGVQRVVTNAVGKLIDGAAMYTVMCYPDGGIVDDCIVYRRKADDYLVVVNASNIEKDFAWMREHAAQLCEVTNESDAWGLIAVQGPNAVKLVSKLAGDDLTQVKGFHFASCTIAGVPCVAARTGYTGEDGFEIFTPADNTRRVWDTIIDAGAKPAGLGARDTLRLEARLSLYGNDIDQTTTPLEAGLGWVVKADAPYVGREALEKQKAEGLTRKLVGFVVRGRGTARHDYPILDREGGSVVGKVTSGAPSPTLGVSIGMGYVPTALSEVGTKLVADCRGKPAEIELVKGPFYKRSQA